MAQSYGDWQRTMRGYLPQASSLLPLFHVWGLQWILHAGFQIYYRWNEPTWIEPATLAAALLISLFVLFRKPARTAEPAAKEWKMALWLLLPLVVLAVSSAVLLYAGAVSWFYGGMLRGLAAALLYVLLGVVFGKTLVYIGLWLLTFSALVSFLYLGFSPIAIQLMGGFSLLGAGWLLQRWSQAAAGSSRSA
ncbi:hypothetical protein J31TS4_43480 [Paenibacillus sp. J31TS4]|uniref:hypothetical protein n=1 Tax=Paenibacillus sp. J31TS4 TaxID=2807195 RepID=UPI001B246FE7|nr:hypothetical protein [Paenibacillus sp. J31TS4]GIP41068.1 hypothetical protein J31TS4_43480 [Paenibacillus sp. J31TS4]